MKTIYIATDSRGYIGPVTDWDATARLTSWTEMIRTKYPDNTYIMRRSAAEIPTHHIYDSELLNEYDDNAIDLAILSTAMYSGIDYVSSGIFKALFGKHYTEDGLKHIQPNGRCVYSHKPSEEEMFALIRRKCKRVVWVGLHNLSRWHLEQRQSTPYIPTAAQIKEDPERFRLSLDKEYTPTYNILAETHNQWFSSLCTDYVALPQTEEWVDNACYKNEFLHYDEQGVQYIINGLDPIIQEVRKG